MRHIDETAKSITPTHTVIKENMLWFAEDVLKMYVNIQSTSISQEDKMERAERFFKDSGFNLKKYL